MAWVIELVGWEFNGQTEFVILRAANLDPSPDPIKITCIIFEIIL